MAIPSASFLPETGGGDPRRSVAFSVELAPCLRAGSTPGCVYSVENHPNDSRVRIDESGKVQALTSRMGTGGGNVPMVMEPFCKSARARSADDATTWKHATVANTLNTFDQGEARANELVVQDAPVYCLQGSMIGRAEKNGPQGSGVNVDIAFTQNATDRPAVVYAIDQQGGKGGANHAKDVMPTLCSDSHGTPHGVVYAMDRAAFNQGQNAQYDPEITDSGVNSTLVARGPGAVAYGIGNGQVHQSTTEEQVGALHCMHDQQAVLLGCAPRYIVRRLTPTECARLQGFADRWGDIEPKTDFTEDELRFWLEVRNTHAAINGKAVKEYTKKQMLTWYSKLQTDSAEYKMWGNGIALPPALYVLQGMVDVLEMSRIYDEATLASYTADDLDWLD